MKTAVEISCYLLMLSGVGRSGDDFVARMRVASELHGRGDYARAEATLLSILEDGASGGPSDPRTGAVLNNLGVMYQYMNRLQDAERCFRQAAAIEEAMRGNDGETPVRALVNLASLYLETDQVRKADQLGLERVAERLRRGGGRPDAAKVLVTLGALESAKRRYEKAERLELDALAILESLAPYGSDAMQALSVLAIVYGETGRYPEALSCAERALAIAEKTLPPGDYTRAAFLSNVGTYQALVHGPANAESFYRQALPIAEDGLGPNHPLVGRILYSYSVVLERTNRKAEAKACRRRANTILMSAEKADPRKYTVDLSELMKHRKH